MRIFAVVPAFQEAERLPSVLDRLRTQVDGVVVVDDGSTDGTGRAAIGREGVWVLSHWINRGQGAALRTGTRAALELGADVVVHIDADGQHSPENIAHVVAPIVASEADIVLGSRYLGLRPEGMPFVRRVLHSGIRQFNRWVLAIPAQVSDPQSGFRALSAEAARSLTFHQDRMAHASEILRLVTRSSWRWKEVPIQVHYSVATLKKGQRSLDAIKVAWQLVLGMFHRSHV